eukprot:s2755_g9.t1
MQLSRSNQRVRELETKVAEAAHVSRVHKLASQTDQHFLHSLGSARGLSLLNCQGLGRSAPEVDSAPTRRAKPMRGPRAEVLQGHESFVLEGI